MLNMLLCLLLCAFVSSFQSPSMCPYIDFSPVCEFLVIVHIAKTGLLRCCLHMRETTEKSAYNVTSPLLLGQPSTTPLTRFSKARRANLSNSVMDVLGPFAYIAISSQLGWTPSLPTPVLCPKALGACFRSSTFSFRKTPSHRLLSSRAPTTCGLVAHPSLPLWFCRHNAHLGLHAPRSASRLSTV